MSTSNTSYHISDELWTIDSTRTCSGATASWIEAGEAIRLGYTSTWYFWSDCRPGSPEFDHWQYVVPSGDYGNYFVWIIWEYSAGSTNWGITMNTASGSRVWSGESTSNSMLPDNINQGLESTDVHVTGANPTYFENAQWQSTRDGSWHSQTNPGNPSSGYSDDPPYWVWITQPSSSDPGGFGESAMCLTCKVPAGNVPSTSHRTPGTSPAIHDTVGSSATNR